MSASIDDKILHTLSVAAPQAGLRLDKWLAGELPELSRSRLQALIASGQVIVNGQPAGDASRKVKAGETCIVDIPPPEAAEPAAQDMALSIQYEDDYLIVIDKPAGLVAHPAPGNPDTTLVNALLHHCSGTLSGIGGVRRPGIVHRLDKNTSGLLVAAKTDAAHRGLAEQFRLHSITRAYRAVCWGVPSPRHGEITGAIGRSARNRKKMAVVERGGKQALTRYKVEKAFAGVASLVECRLATGRTHQIRVHMTSIGHPLVGDEVYGSSIRRSGLGKLTEDVRAALTGFHRQALHAYQLGFIHPINNQSLIFHSKLPIDFNELVNTLESL
ncbi:MAG TPA: RluA family pseudouridine synthase [Rhodospirillaceae bacterium]|nr:RluA family pseudouridine synthase [Rhodospirillaceae bacterium]